MLVRLNFSIFTAFKIGFSVQKNFLTCLACFVVDIVDIVNLMGYV